jgi:hypothetical protein
LWESREHAPLFSRAGITIRDGSGVKTMFFNPAITQMAPWVESAGESGPRIHVPVTAATGIETVFEIDLRYLQQTWLYLTDHYLNYPVALVRLSRIQPDALRDLLNVAWRFVTAETGHAKRARRKQAVSRPRN